MLGRIPLRLRLTLVFAGVMAVLLGGAGLILRASLAGSIDASIEASLRARAGDVAALVAQADEGLAEAGQSPLTEAGESFAQVLDRRGRVVDATPLLRDTPLLDRAELSRAARGTLILDRSEIPGVEGPTRLLATPAEGDEGPLVLVVGASLEDRRDTLRNLAVLLFVGGPIALLLASAAGYGLAAATLRPVEAMRARAAHISGEGVGERLPVPAADDEIGRLAETLNDMLTRLEQAMLRERGFVADASHELRTPLAILKTELELALRGERSAAQLRAAIASAGEETERLVRLAEDLLVIARSDQGRLPTRPETIAARDLLQRVRERFAGRADREGRPIDLVVDGPISVRGDRLRLEQALGNLLANALVHGSGRITLTADRVADQVELRVSDEGPGMPPDFLASAFERFSRADPARGRGGAGLGLSIVRAIARAHGGEANVKNRGGGGLDAWIVLPADGPIASAPAGGAAEVGADLRGAAGG